jgi:hypothetical protein
MDDILQWILDHTPAFVFGVVRYIVDGIRAIWSRILDFFLAAGRAFGAQIAWIKWWINVFEDLMLSVYQVASWIIKRLIPDLTTMLVNRITQWFNSALDWAAKFTLQLVNEAKSIARTLIDALTQYAVSWITAIRTWIADLVAKVEWLLHQVVTLLTDPAKLAEWLVAAMLKAAGRYLLANARPLARIIWPMLLPGAVYSARILETIITDIF